MKRYKKEEETDRTKLCNKSVYVLEKKVRDEKKKENIKEEWKRKEKVVSSSHKSASTQAARYHSLFVRFLWNILKILILFKMRNMLLSFSFFLFFYFCFDDATRPLLYIFVLFSFFLFFNFFFLLTFIRID